MNDGQAQLHGSCVVLNGAGILLLGDSGSGKSQLAWELIQAGAALVADDRVVLQRSGEQLLASPEARLEGLIECYGVGVLRLPCQHNVPLLLAVELSEMEPERLPEPYQLGWLGIALPALQLKQGYYGNLVAVRVALQAVQEKCLVSGFTEENGDMATG